MRRGGGAQERAPVPLTQEEIMEQLSRIKIGDEEYPIKCDLAVLQEIQEQYGSINQFERELVGVKLKLDASGKVETDEEGKPVKESVEPSIRSIIVALPLMINEGLQIRAEELNTPFEPVDPKEIIRACAIPFDTLAGIIHDEFARCFRTKK